MFPGRRLVDPRTIFFLVLSMLFSQTALATYLCPTQTPVPMTMESHASDAPCAGMDPVQPVLCHQHVADSGQAVQLAQLVAPTPAIVQVLLVPVLPDAGAAVPLGRAAVRAERPPPDPVFLSTLRLRV